LVKEFPLSPMERIAKKAGAKRVSVEAAKALREIMLEYAYKVATDAVIVAKHAGRVTVKGKDVKLVASRR